MPPLPLVVEQHIHFTGQFCPFYRTGERPLRTGRGAHVQPGGHWCGCLIMRPQGSLDTGRIGNKSVHPLWLVFSDEFVASNIHADTSLRLDEYMLLNFHASYMS
ncbi:hypothetical protein D1007_56124 [Hordeum vulgare]|nr:hypothetical protein D1007_56124 [Hordeum vulgare]